jgi:hypothetical protein
MQEILLPIFAGIISILLGIVSFFLVRTMSKLDATHDLAQKNETKILLLQQKEEMTKTHIDEKFDALQKSIQEIKEIVKSNHNR